MTASCVLRTGQEDQPADFKYTHMWVSADGETHLKECAMKGFEMKKFAETEQWVKPTESPTKVRLTSVSTRDARDVTRSLCYVCYHK